MLAWSCSRTDPTRLPQAGTPRELSSARMHLRGAVKAAAERFGEHPLYAQLQQLLGEVEAARGAPQAAGAL